MIALWPSQSSHTAVSGVHGRCNSHLLQASMNYLLLAVFTVLAFAAAVIIICKLVPGL